MSFINSLFFGFEGQYQLRGIEITFKKLGQNGYYHFSGDFVGKTAGFLLQNRVVQVLTFGYLHAFVHEMGHALASYILTGKSSHIEIDTNTCTAQTILSSASNSIQNTIILTAGPCTDVAFSVSQIFTAVVLSPSITLPVSLGISFGASFWIFGEFYYAAHSLISNSQGLIIVGPNGHGPIYFKNQDSGDFARIANHGPFHLAGALSVMVSIVALGIIGIRSVI